MILPTAKTVRTAATKAAIGVFGFFFVGLATHLYDAYLTKGGVELSGVLRTLETIATSTPIAWIVGITIWVAAGLWLDAFLRRKENEPLLAQARIGGRPDTTGESTRRRYLFFSTRLRFPLLLISLGSERTIIISISSWLDLRLFRHHRHLKVRIHCLVWQAG